MSRTLFIAAAAVLALGAGFIAQRTIASRSGDGSTVAVLVVTEDLEIGRQVAERHLTWQQWPKANLNPRYVTMDNKPDARKALVGATVRQSLFGGEPVTTAKLLKRDNAGVLSVVLEEGKRAVTIKVDEAQGLAGLVRPGDRVDVILTHKVTAAQNTARSGERSVSEAVARNARVLAVGQDVKTEETAGNGAKQQKIAKSVTLEVDEEQAEAVALGRTLGTMSLSLRSVYTEAEESGDVAARVKPWTSDEDISNLLRRERNKAVRTLTVARPLKAGSFLTDADLAWTDAPNGADLSHAFVDSRDGEHHLNGALLLNDLEAGQVVSRDTVVRPGENRFVPRALRPGYRAISVAIAGNSAVGGFVSPGDVVDVLYSDKFTDSTAGAQVRERNWSETVAAGVRVLSIEAAVDLKTDLPKGGGTATLEGSPRQVEAILLAANMGKLILTLRSADDAPAQIAAEDMQPSRGYITDMDLSSGLRALAGERRMETETPAPAVESAAAPPPPAPAKEMVLIRGRERTVVTLGPF
jgi:pilus assembly protein CpaB